MKSGLQQGELTTWKDDRGFGFIQPFDGSSEVFLHISELKDSTRRPQIGDTIHYKAVIQDGKVRATNAFIQGARISSTSKSTGLSQDRSSGSVSKKSFPIAKLLAISALPAAGIIHFFLVTRNPIPLILYAVMSLLTFALYADDKERAQRGKWRVPEKTLHLFEFAGGWLGGFFGQQLLRHKSSKLSYQIVFWVIVALHWAFWLTWIFRGQTLVKDFLEWYSR